MKIDTCKRYNGIETIMKGIGTDGCYFLILCSIIEDVTNSNIDLINVIKTSLEHNWIRTDYYINDPCAILRHYTGKMFHIKVLSKMPDIIGDNDYAVEKWYNDRTKFKHFKRPFINTLENSVTVKEGYISEVYIFWYK